MDEKSDITITTTKYEKGKTPTQTNVVVPANQAWLYYAIAEQTKLLKQINTAVEIVAVIVLLTAIVTGCGSFLK